MSQWIDIKSPDGGRIWGRVEIKDNGDKWAYQMKPYKIVAMYDHMNNITTDFLHKPLSQGDTAASWIKPC